MTIARWIIAAWCLSLAGCGTSATEDAATEGSATDDASATDDTSGGLIELSLLGCPVPGFLPFVTETNDFVTDDARRIAETNPRIKDEATDILGNRDGVAAHTATDAQADPSSGTLALLGKKARTTPEMGLVSVALEGEWVSLWGWNGTAWDQLARGQTDTAGQYVFADVAPSLAAQQPHYAVLEADGTCTPHYNFLLPSDMQVVVADIDGTLTLSDDELFMQLEDGSYDPQQNGAASTLLRAWADKGYVVIYLSARLHAFRSESRVWLDEHAFPVGPIITANSLVVGESARAYKAAWLQRLDQDFGWQITAAYGNATSDIDAYEDAGIPKNVTFIIGEHAGEASTVAIPDNDYAAHIEAFVAAQPDAQQPS
jgi:hypothetical protein